jgi:hypothetical protein
MEKLIAALERIATTDGIFYADEIGLNGGTMKMLHNAGYVKPTGRTKPLTITIRQGTETRTIEVKEWKVTALYIALICI